MRDPRRIRCTYYIEAVDVARAAAALAGEQSSGTFIAVPGESDRIRERHAAEVVEIRELGECAPSLPSRSRPERVTAAEVVVEFPMVIFVSEFVTLFTDVACNLFEFVLLYYRRQLVC